MEETVCRRRDALAELERVVRSCLTNHEFQDVVRIEDEARVTDISFWRRRGHHMGVGAHAELPAGNQHTACKIGETGRW